MRASAKTTLILGDLLQVPIGLVPVIDDPTPKLTKAPEPTAAEPDEVPEAPRELAAPTAEDAFAALDAEADGPDKPEVPAFTKGIKTGRGKDAVFHPIPDALLDEAREETRVESVEVVEFIDYRRVPTDRLTGSYYVQPDKGFARPLRTIMDAMRLRGRAAVVRFAVRDKEQLGVVRVRKTDKGDVLLLNTVAFAASWREPDAAILAAAEADAPSEQQVEAAAGLLDALAGDGATLKEARDEYAVRLAGLVERAQDGEWDDLLNAPSAAPAEAEAPVETAKAVEAQPVA
jgi:non-homologous end joining protein Ku